VLSASDASLGTQLGYWHNALSMDGNRILAGAPFAPNSNGGAAYLFEYDGQQWNEVHKFTPSVPQIDSQYGRSVLIAGNRAIIAAPRYDVDGIYRAGRIFVYTFDGNQWNEELSLASPDPGERYNFGWTMDADGGKFLIGEYGGPPAVDYFSGRAHFITDNADCDGDGLLDECAVAEGAPDCNNNLVPDECDPDMDGNGIPDGCYIPFCLSCGDPADLDDYDDFRACLYGPGAMVSGDCDPLDADDDGFVTLFDFAVFQRQFTSP